MREREGRKEGRKEGRSEWMNERGGKGKRMDERMDERENERENERERDREGVGSHGHRGVVWGEGVSPREGTPHPCGDGGEGGGENVRSSEWVLRRGRSGEVFVAMELWMYLRVSICMHSEMERKGRGEERGKVYEGMCM